MRSLIFLLPCALASEYQTTEENTLMQINRMKIKEGAKTSGAMALLERVQAVANSMVEGSETHLSKDAVDDALAAANDALSTISPAIQQQVDVAQNAVNDAFQAVMTCHNAEQAALRASLLTTAQEYAGDAQSCANTLQTLNQEEAEICGRAEDCLCDEARVRTTDQEVLCQSKTQTYELAFCEHDHVCTIFAECHYSEADVYRGLIADVQAEMEQVEQEFIAAEQSSCLMGLIMTAMLTATPINPAAMAGCAAVDVMALAIDYPEVPANPSPCPAASFGNPQCAAWTLIAHQEVSAGYFSANARNTLNQNENDPSNPIFMNVGTLTPSDFLIDGKYSFRLTYGGVRNAASSCNDIGELEDRQEFEWTQTSWITETTVQNYQPVSPPALAASPNAGCVFSGVARSSTSATVFDGSPSHGNWFHSIGSISAWNSGIPAFKGAAAQTMSLYVRRAPSYSHVHDGHCAGGWLGGNTNQASEAACSAVCRANADCRYFAYCRGPTGCDGATNCALYNEAAGCPDDDNWGAYEAYINHGARTNAPADLSSGFYRIQQKVNMMYVDAHESGNDHNAVTRDLQDNPSQWWRLQSVGPIEDQVFTMQQVGTNANGANGRYLDAHESSSNDYRVVTRTSQNNDSQRWRFTMVDANTFTINHVVNNRFVDAYEGSNDNVLVTREAQDNDSQKWVMTPLSLEQEGQALALMR